MKKLFSILVVLFAVIGLVGCGGEPGAVIQVNSYITSLSENNVADTWSTDLNTARVYQDTTEEKAEVEGGLNISNIPEGYRAEYKKVDLEMSAGDITLWGDNPLIYPGNLLKINPVTDSTDYSQLSGLKRAPITISANLEGATGTQGGLSKKISEPSLSYVREGIRDIVNNNMVQGAELPCVISLQLVEVKANEDIALSLGATIKGGTGSFKASLEGSLNLKEGSKMTYAMILLKQVYYRINTDYPEMGAAGFFDKSVSLADYKAAIGSSDVPAYISSVTYGRVAAITIKTSYSYSELQAKLNLKANVGEFVDAEIKSDFLSNTDDSLIDLECFVYGGIGASQQVLGLTNYGDIIDVLKTPYNPTQSVGLPISYTISHLGSNNLAHVGSSASYYVKNLYPIQPTDVNFTTKFKTDMNTAVIGGTYTVEANRDPSDAVLFPVRLQIIGAMVEENEGSKYKAVLSRKIWEDTIIIATLRMDTAGTTGFWLLEIADDIRNIGQKINIVAVCNGIEDRLEIDIKVTKRTIDFYSEGVCIDSETTQYDGRFAKPQDPYLSGKTFLGWYTQDGVPVHFGSDNRSNDIFIKDTVLYARYALEFCTVTFKNYYLFSNPNTLPDRVDLIECTTSINVPNPERAGFTFTGWYQDELLTIPFYGNVGTNNNLTLFAKWVGVPISSFVLTISKTTNLLPYEQITLTATINPELARPGRTVTYELVNSEQSQYVTIIGNKLTVNKIKSYSAGAIGIKARCTDGETITLSDTVYIYILSDWNFIYSADDIQTTIRNYPTSNHRLMDNIDMSAYLNWTPIPSFSGILEGDGKTISNLKVNIGSGAGNVGVNSYYGFFGTNAGVIRNITFSSCTTFFGVNHDGGTSDNGWANVGIVAGGNSTSGYITNITLNNCRVEAHRNRSQAGGVVGINGGTINYCTVNGLYITGNGDMGGISGGQSNVGIVTGCTVIKSTLHHFQSADGSIANGSRSIGGIVGYCEGGTIQSCNVLNYTGFWFEDSASNWSSLNSKRFAGIIVGWQKNGQIANVGADIGFEYNNSDGRLGCYTWRTKNGGQMVAGTYFSDSKGNKVNIRSQYFSVGWGYTGKLEGSVKVS